MASSKGLFDKLPHENDEKKTDYNKKNNDNDKNMKKDEEEEEENKKITNSVNASELIFCLISII